MSGKPKKTGGRQPAVQKPKVYWDDAFYLESYLLAKAGATNTQIAAALNVNRETFDRWFKLRPALAAALERARGPETTSFKDYVYNRLAPELKKFWDELNPTDGEGADPRILLKDQGKRLRQQLFLFALVNSSFNASEACRRVGINPVTLHLWVNNDPEFKELYTEMHWHKGNFYEEHLVKGVARGDPGLVMFANRTYNRDRGYAERQELKIDTTVKHEHTVVRIADLEAHLSTDVLLALYDAVKAMEDKKSRDADPVAVPALGHREVIEAVAVDGG